MTAKQGKNIYAPDNGKVKKRRLEKKPSQCRALISGEIVSRSLSEDTCGVRESSRRETIDFPGC